MQTTEATTTAPALDTTDEPRTRHFWAGTLDSCPIQNATIGGISFPRFSEDVHYDPKRNTTLRSHYAGAVVALDDEQAKRVEEAIARKRVRFSHSRQRGWIVDTKDARYRRQPTDEPLAKHVYMKAVDPGFHPPFQASPFIEAAKEQAKASEVIARTTPGDADLRKALGEAKRTGQTFEEDLLGPPQLV